MGRVYYFIMAFLAALLIISVFVGCNKETESKNILDLEEFENAMKEKGYDFEIQDVQQDFLPTTRKRMISEDIAIDIYLFNNEEDMESEVSFIDSGGCSYNNGHKAVNVSWVSYPHFYKKGSLIVQFVGEDDNIIRDLENILGDQFAGYKP